jgi:hypothetical protein
MKYPTLAIAALSLSLAAPAMAESPAMKAENAMKMESHDKMPAGMSGKKKDTMKPMKKADKASKDAMRGDMAMKPDMKH